MTIDQRAVVSHSQRPLDMAHHQRLGIQAVGNAVTRITDMADCHLALPQREQPILVKNFMGQTHILIRSEYAIIVDCNAAALLTTMLQCIQSIICAQCHIG